MLVAACRPVDPYFYEPIQRPGCNRTVAQVQLLATLAGLGDWFAQHELADLELEIGLDESHQLEQLSSREDMSEAERHVYGALCWMAMDWDRARALWSGTSTQQSRSAVSLALSNDIPLSMEQQQAPGGAFAYAQQTGNLDGLVNHATPFAYYEAGELLGNSGKPDKRQRGLDLLLQAAEGGLEDAGSALCIISQRSWATSTPSSVAPDTTRWVRRKREGKENGALNGEQRKGFC